MRFAGPAQRTILWGQRLVAATDANYEVQAEVAPQNYMAVAAPELDGAFVEILGNADSSEAFRLRS